MASSADNAASTLGIDTSVAHPARRYDYWLGGKDNFAADRASGDAVAEAFPTVRTAAIENRRFLGRAVRYLAAEAGIRQFLDVGTGIPTANNTHEVAQAIAPDTRVVYVDNDPIVLTHARALLTSKQPGATTYIDADLREPGTILDNPELTRVLDLDRPVALMLVAVLHFVLDDQAAAGYLGRLRAALPAGSYLALTHVTSDFMAPAAAAEFDRIALENKFINRPHDRIGRFFDGLELVPPGLVSVADWRPDADTRPTPAEVSVLGGVARI